MSSKIFIRKMKESLLNQKKDLYLLALKSEDIDMDGDETDEIQGNMIIEMCNQLSSRNNDKMSRIDSALKRIEDNSYGVCNECGEEIPEKRLLLNPYFLTCVCCAEELELAEKQRKRS
jgi:DnaK suppressor protein